MPAAPDGSGNQPPGGAPWGKLTPQALSALARPPRFPPEGGYPPEGGLPPEGGCPPPPPNCPDGRRTPCFLRHLLTPLVSCPAGGAEEAEDVGVELPPPQPATTMAVNIARPAAGSRACRKCREHSRSGTWLRPGNGSPPMDAADRLPGIWQPRMLAGSSQLGERCDYLAAGLDFPQGGGVRPACAVPPRRGEPRVRRGRGAGRFRWSGDTAGRGSCDQGWSISRWRLMAVQQLTWAAHTQSH